jgi:Cd2+/Zn2+-exporting ATPase/Cu+-exporting ATPase
MDCAECTLHVQHALEKLPGVYQAQVYLAAEKAVIQLDPSQVTLPLISRAVSGAGYSVPMDVGEGAVVPGRGSSRLPSPVLGLYAGLFTLVLLIVIVGEWMGLFAYVNELLPFWLGALLVLAAGSPFFLKVIKAALHRQVLSHTLMSLGVLAALLVGEWVTALVVIFFMNVGDYTERYTAGRARSALKDLAQLTPRRVRVERDGSEVEIPVEQVTLGEIAVVRPGEAIPVDGLVVGGHASVDQSAITGESMPVEVGPGCTVFAATTASLGALRLRVTAVGPDTTFGHILRLVEQAEANRAQVQRIADRFSAYFLPVVLAIALLTLVLRRDPMAAAAVLVVACSCSFALATPIAVLASIGAGAKHGLLIKGGRCLELLAQADVLLIDKTGTLTLGLPQVSQIISLDGRPELDILSLAAAAERYSEHPLAGAVRRQAAQHGLQPGEPQDFAALPGAGVRANVQGLLVEVGGASLGRDLPSLPASFDLAGRTLVYVFVDGQPVGLLALQDTLRPEVPDALRQVRELGIGTIELLTGDSESVAAPLAAGLGLSYRAGMLPEHKIDVVRQYQAQGRVVVMVGDGVNDAPALAQADVGIAMGAAGSQVAIDAAHVALMREDWTLVPHLLRIARRTVRTIRGNLWFTVIYNILGLSLAALGYLPPMLAAAAQSLPDLGILANSSRLLQANPIQKETQ